MKMHVPWEAGRYARQDGGITGFGFALRKRDDGDYTNART